ncbi:DNA polymerase III subunit delta' [Stakelama saccharophila]|uniref:DNA polymerase III subunit delta n=1 Tax=Stakelama saccharophila TaxID=3075605 RepID=A0ABZ0B591_9SPHN|nr:DNA polymerase III subunit delta' [Stakelama sp. W311]WNO52529.1 DNA polymerase III subunit delta' [Stakelama sp. W311]
MKALVGNEDAKAAFFAAASGSNIPHAWLFAGPQGLGKAAFAQEAAARLLAHAADPAVPLDVGLPAGDVAAIRQVAAGSHPDFRLLRRLPKDPEKPDQNVARSIPIAQIRALQPMFATKPTYSDRRVVVIDSIDDCERAAANALLKNLEEPPAGTIFLLISHAPGRLLPTIRSRCRLLRFSPLEDGTVAGILRAELPEASDEEIAVLVRACQGAPGRALAFAGLDMSAIEHDLRTIASEGDRTNAIRVRMSSALGTKSAQARYEAFLRRVPSFIAERARSEKGGRLLNVLDAHRAARDLAATALRLSLDPQATVFEMGGIVARLSPSDNNGLPHR